VSDGNPLVGVMWAVAIGCLVGGLLVAAWLI
jgi:hypothetical protein